MREKLTRVLRFYWQTISFASHHNPPRFVELVMMFLAIFLLGIWWQTQVSAYLFLSLSYVISASVSILVREAFLLPRRLRITQVLAMLLLIISAYSFATDLIRYF